MPNWLQLLEHTAEFSPGPWSIYRACGSLGVEIVRWPTEPKEDEDRIGLGHVRNFVLCPLGKAARDFYDHEAEANARLMADAPAMLLLLARFQTYLEAPSVRVVPSGVSLRAWSEAAREILARHVRVGYEPPTAREAAARSDPPPPPPPPTLLDMVGD